MNLPDNYDLWERYDAEQERKWAEYLREESYEEEIEGRQISCVK